MTTTHTPHNLARRSRTVTLLLLLAAITLIVGGAGASAYGLYTKTVETRGWVDPAADGADLPYRLPLPGVNVELTQYDAAALPDEVARIAAAGFVWVRQSFAWDRIEPEQGAPDFRAYDRIMEAVATEPTLRIVAVLEGTPAWARRREADSRPTAPPASMEAFAAFAAAVAARYSDRIDYYQVWDEPNLTLAWGGLDPRPADYAAMLRAAYPAIKAADADATVITAGLAPTVEIGPRNLSDVLFLRALYEAGARDSFDAVAAKPYGFNSSPLDRTVDPSVLNFSRLILLREEMARRGDGGKALWASHFGWNSLPEGWRGPPSIWGQVSAETRRDWTRAAYERAAREWPWAGGMILQAWRPAAAADDPIQGFAVNEVASDWFEGGAFFRRGAALGVGLHHPTGPRIEYTNKDDGAWRFGPLGADVQLPTGFAGDPPPDGSLHRLTFSFSGETLGFRLRRDNYVAFLYPRVDGGPANALPSVSGTGNASDGEAYILLKSPDLEPRTETILAARLPTEAGDQREHTAEARIYLGYERWLLAGIAVGKPPDVGRFDRLIGGGLIAAALGILIGGLSIRRVPRAFVRDSARTAAQYGRQASGTFGAILVSILSAITLLLTVNQILPTALRRDTAAAAATIAAAGALVLSPSLIITIAALAVLWLLIFNRPAIGLALVVFWMPFFLAPVELYIWALPMVEIALLLTASAMLARLILRRLGARLDEREAEASEPVLAVPRLRLADGAMLLFVIVAVLSIAWAEQLNPATRELRIIILEPALFFLLLRTARLTRSELVRLVDVFLLAGAAVSTIGLIQYVTGGPGVTVAEQGARRLMSVYSSPNNLALFLGRVIPFGVAMTLIAPGTLRRAAAAALTAITGLAMILTQSVGAAILGLPAALAVVLLLWDWRRGRVIVALIIVGIVGLFAASRSIPRLQGVLDLSRSSAFIRTQLWTSAANLIRERALTGAGLDQFLYLYRSRYILPEAWEEPDLSHPHNVALDFWIRLGILGLPILLALQLGFWRGALRAWAFWRHPDGDRLLAALAVGAAGSMAYFLAHGLVDNSYFVVDLAYAFCFTLALVTRLTPDAVSSATHAPRAADSSG